MNESRIINSVAFLDLLQKQFSRIKEFNNGEFYLNHLLDFRTRVYVENYPINYQLSHLVRVVIKLSQKVNVNKIFNKFKKIKIIRKHLLQCKILLADKYNIE